MAGSKLFRDYQRAFEAATGLLPELRDPQASFWAESADTCPDSSCARLGLGRRSCAACLFFQQKLAVAAEHSALTRECHAGFCETVVPVRTGNRVIALLHIGQVRLRARGDPAAEIRGFFEVAGRRRRELEKIYGARFAGATVEGEQFSDLADRSRPVELQVSLRIPALLQTATEGRVLPSLDDFFETARELGGLASLETRRHDLVLGPPRRSRLSVVFLLPAGSSARELPAAREISGRFGRFSLRHERSREGGREKVVATRVIEITAPRVSRTDYPEFRELAAAVARLKDEKMVVGK